MRKNIDILNKVLLRGGLLKVALVFIIATVSTSRLAAISTVATGFDLFETAPGTTFLGFDWEGVRLGVFDFGDGNGDVNVGSTDTIIERKDPAVVPTTPGTAPEIDIELVALQLRSTNLINLGAGAAYHFITLQSAVQSDGKMTISFDDDLGGLFDSFIDVFFDVRIGSIDGSILFSDSLRLASSNTEWDRIPPPGSLQIDGVNKDLNGVDRTEDFWSSVEEVHPSGAKHNVIPSVPDSSSAFQLFATALLALASFRFRFLKAKR